MIRVIIKGLINLYKAIGIFIFVILTAIITMPFLILNSIADKTQKYTNIIIEAVIDIMAKICKIIKLQYKDMEAEKLKMERELENNG